MNVKNVPIMIRTSLGRHLGEARMVTSVVPLWTISTHITLMILRKYLYVQSKKLNVELVHPIQFFVNGAYKITKTMNIMIIFEEHLSSLLTRQYPSSLTRFARQCFASRIIDRVILQNIYNY
jgi:hypothetical protein